MSNTWIMIFGISLIFIATSGGASLIFFFKKEISPKLNTVISGFASGVMIAASVWCLLSPALSQSSDLGSFSYMPVLIGFMLGGVFIVSIDKIIPHLRREVTHENDLKNHLKKSTKLFLAVTIHNIPEGLAVGVAFGSAVLAGDQASYISALGLAIGIAVQNIPEGMAISLPMKKQTGSNFKSFLYGLGSGVVEPISAVLGIFIATQVSMLMPWLLAFAAGAMIFVVAEDLIPDAKLNEESHLGTWGVMVGFALMMMLDALLG